jgi:hypothetical protein
VNINAFSRSLAAATVLLAAPALAEQFGPLEIAGFAKDEFSMCDNCSDGLVNDAAYDPRGVLNPPTPMLNQPGDTGFHTHNLGLAQLTLGLTHEFDNAIRVEGRASARVRNSGPDIYDNYVIDLYAGISHPTFGSAVVGKMSTRAWTRSDDFAYPLGLSSPWAESGAGYGVIPEAVRLATRDFEIGRGRILFEATAGRADKRKPLNADSTYVPPPPPDDCVPTDLACVPPSPSKFAPPSPKIYEGFIQYSNEKNLVELIYQYSSGGRQSSFMKGAFYGAQGDTNGPATSPGYKKPSESVLILQGKYWMNPTWSFTYGVKQDWWSGQQQQCDYGPVSPVASDCFWDQPGFNYASDFKLHDATEYDVFMGAAYAWKLWSFTLGGVRMNKAYTKTPTEWGQSNTATFLNLGVYRTVPEIPMFKGVTVEVYGGLGRTMFGRQGPAPLGMPSNTAFGDVDPRVSESANHLTLGMNLKF